MKTSKPTGHDYARAQDEVIAKARAAVLVRTDHHALDYALRQLRDALLRMDTIAKGEWPDDPPTG
jgi:hypothetical protein